MDGKELAEVLTSLDMLVLKRTSGDFLTPLDPAPSFISQIFPLRRDSKSNGWDKPSSPFLAFFLEDALKFWESGEPGPLWSEPWTESDPVNGDQSFQATALSLAPGNYLVVSCLTRIKDDRPQLLQVARQKLLLQRYLEEEIARRTESLRQREEEIVLRLIGAADYRDEETGSHIRRMGLYAAALARKLGWYSMQVDMIRLAAPMHDVGKIGIPDSILLKADRLNEQEFAIMKTHTLIGAKILADSQSELLRMAHNIALRHHENWDGSGYPDGLAGEDIPMAARLVAVCDVFDALSHERVYRGPLPHKEVLHIMDKLRGVKFDPVILDVFLDILPEILGIQEANQEDGGLAPYKPLWET